MEDCSCTHVILRINYLKIWMMNLPESIVILVTILVILSDQ